MGKKLKTEWQATAENVIFDRAPSPWLFEAVVIFRKTVYCFSSVK
jgi:hypothetical protein